MLISQLSLDVLNRVQITNLVFGTESEMDIGNLGDCIFVFGGTNIERAEKAVELFRDGRAAHILFTGGDKYGKRNPSEAILLRDKAIELGIPEQSTWIETMSNTTLENIVCSLVILERNFGLHNLTRILLVSSPWHMRRCILMCRTFLPPWVEIVWCPDNRIIGRRDNWWEDDDSERGVMNEAFKVVNGVKQKYFVDADVQI